ncbi:MAG: hypothetical protein AAFO04_05770 [Cyanobacteria bacterium J06592_8]
MIKFSIVLLLLLIFLICPQPAQASQCYTIEGNQICILKIKRSAKYHWEYRASVSINGKKKPIEIYNCRTKTKITAERRLKRFEKNGVGKLICSLLNK